MIYREQLKVPNVHFSNTDFREQYEAVKQRDNVIVVTDPPFNIGYHYGQYKDRMNEEEYFNMLVTFLKDFPCVFIHYPEELYEIAIRYGKKPEKVISWVYNSNTARQHRDVAYWNVKPDFTKTRQPYKNPTDKRIRERIARGIGGGRMYDWWNVNQVKNVSKDKSSHPCQMPIEVMKNIISTLPEDCIVFDPFMGSGTTAVACVDLGYDFIGCEIDPTYYEIAKVRINAEEIEDGKRNSTV